MQSFSAAFFTFITSTLAIIWSSWLKWRIDAKKPTDQVYLLSGLEVILLKSPSPVKPWPVWATVRVRPPPLFALLLRTWLNLFVPLGLTLIGPVIVNILCFHVFLEPSGLPMAIVVS